MGRASVGVARKRGLTKCFCATPTEALFVSVDYMPKRRGGSCEAFLTLTYRAFSI